MILPWNRPRRSAALSLLVGALVVTLAGCSFGPPPPDESGAPPRLPSPSPSASSGDTGQAAVDVIAKHLSVPWGVAFLPDGTGLATERDTGRILKVGPAIGTDGLQVTPVQTLAGFAPGGDGGLLGIAVSPHYTTDQTVYIYYSTPQDNRIASLVLGGTPTPIVTGIPHAASDNGGALGFGPDGFLYASTGDAGDKASAANPKSLAGKILRMTPAGKPAPGNPADDSLIYASGFHNPLGLAWDTQKRLYATDLGQSSWDELNLITAGKNYGWPAAEGPADNPRYTDPLVTWKPAQAGCAGLAISGPVAVTGCLTGTRLYLMQLTEKGGTLGAPQTLLQGAYGRLRTVAPAPDGSLWVTTSNKDGLGNPGVDDDQILRIVPAGSGVSLS